MKNIPTDFELMKEIYVRYYEEFRSFNETNSNRVTKTYIPIDIVGIAKHFKTDEEIVFGRLYLYLEKKYGFKNDDGSLSPFFSKKLGKDQHVVNFPLLASILAGLKEERKKQNITLFLSIAAISISLMSLGFNGIKTLYDLSHSSNDEATTISKNIENVKDPVKISIQKEIKE